MNKLTYVRANPSPTTGEHMIKQDGKNGYIAEIRDIDGNAADNARRIVACWNSLAHLTIKEIEAMSADQADASHALDHIFGDVMEQLDELRIR